MSGSFQQQPLRVFFSYAHEDDSYRIRLEKALKLLQRQKLIEPWSDRKILPGGDWAEEIDRELNRADLILLLVSDDFLHSDYCWGIEVGRAMERQKVGEAVVVPVVLRAADWTSAPSRRPPGRRLGAAGRGVEGRLHRAPPVGRGDSTAPGRAFDGHG